MEKALADESMRCATAFTGCGVLRLYLDTARRHMSHSLTGLSGPLTLRWLWGCKHNGVSRSFNTVADAKCPTLFEKVEALSGQKALVPAVHKTQVVKPVDMCVWHR